MSSMRDDFEAAFEDSELPEEPTAAEVETDEPDETTESEAVEEVAESSVEIGESPSETETTQVVDAPADTSETAIEATGKENESLKAPVDWSPKQREDWSKIPRHLQEKIMSREQDMTKAMEGTGQARKVHEHLSNLTQRYGTVLGAEGYKNPMQAIEGLFQTVAQLRMGSESEKAQTMAKLINQYGININSLDDALVGTAPSQEQAQGSQFEQMLDQRMAPVNQLMQQMQQLQQNQAQQAQHEADNSVKDFSSNAEFINDVRDSMADMLDMAAKRGQAMTLQQAYDTACAVHPEISKIVNQRNQDATLMGNQNNLNSKLNAASSISGKVGGAGGKIGNLSMRDQLLASWDSAAAG